MKPLREDEIDEIESLKYFIKYLNSKRDAEGWEIWDAMLRIDKIGRKYILSEIATEQELSQLLDMDDVKEMINKLRVYLLKNIQ